MARFLIVEARFYDHLNDMLIAGARRALKAAGHSVEVLTVPGALEIPLALATDALWGKRRMLEVYLNVAEWGEGVFGAEAAAQRWFGKPARDLTRGEAALLAAVLPNPILRNPALPSRGVRAQATRIQARMNGVTGLMGCLKR